MILQTEIELVSAAETWPLRQRVLKPFLRESECVYPEDEFKTTFHLGLFHNDKLLSVATFMQESSPHFSAGFPYRLRGMATDMAYRSQGFGGILLRNGIEKLKSRRCDLLWCQARVMAFSFYKKLGFHFHGELFELPNIGAHKVMYKVIIPR